MLPRTRALAASLVVLTGSVSAIAQTAPQTPPITAEEMRAALRTDDFTIPTPGEFMAALNKVGKPDWSAKERRPIPTDFPTRGQRALNLGTLIADGYIAVEAESKAGVKNCGKDISAMAKGLGVAEAITSRGASLIDFAEEGQWDTLREELEATQNEVKAKFAEGSDKDLITLVTVGAWFRGTEAIASHVAKTYTADGAQLLRQPGIVDFLAAKLDALPEKLRDEPAVKRARVKLTEFKVVVGFPREKVADQETVKRIYALAAEIVADLAKKDLK